MAYIGFTRYIVYAKTDSVLHTLLSHLYVSVHRGCMAVARHTEACNYLQKALALYNTAPTAPLTAAVIASAKQATAVAQAASLQSNGSTVSLQVEHLLHTCMIHLDSTGICYIAHVSSVVVVHVATGCCDGSEHC
jgi:hypothetical protein